MLLALRSSATRGPTPRTYITSVSRRVTDWMLMHSRNLGRILVLHWTSAKSIILATRFFSGGYPQLKKRSERMPTLAVPTVDGIMAELKSKGKEQTRKIYSR